MDMVVQASNTIFRMGCGSRLVVWSSKIPTTEVCVMSYFVAFMETFTISAFPYYTFENRSQAYTIGYSAKPSLLQLSKRIACDLRVLSVAQIGRKCFTGSQFWYSSQEKQSHHFLKLLGEALPSMQFIWSFLCHSSHVWTKGQAWMLATSICQHLSCFQPLMNIDMSYVSYSV